LTDFAGVREMGIITGGGLLACLVPMMTMLPVMLLRGRQNAMDRVWAGNGLPLRERAELLVLGRPGWVTFGSLVLSAVSVVGAGRVYFDYDLRNLQSAGLPAVEYEKKLMNSTPRSVLFGAVLASNLIDAVRLESRLTSL
jgi:hypothetical protein